ncbi:hypothetical protein [[Clostridium] polysaccharolyticum]|uniref:Uncharacterized protein n=1 Tax=[Clostridium] polysaccharolyticum TaxID=29364 RepID=A0A1H9ZCH1_9FIRM|nr:hypothetical protein [[Clostridium] polysaccharolyticum]SES79320.1 hypothetical protein SAMN04487772_103135 [[Clostridium] polysaccharolyticum]
MLNEKKIRLMTRLSLFEEYEGKEEIKIDRYYKIDYIRYQILKSMLCVTLGYVLILLAVFVYQSEYILDNITSIAYKSVGVYILTGYLFLLLFYSFITGIVSCFRYERSRKKMKKYKKNLKTLKLLCEEESELK